MIKISAQRPRRQFPKPFQNKKGFALLMAIVLTSTLLLITYALSNITLKALNLSYAGKNSELAFYAADTGVECAQYWDIRNPGELNSAFSNPSPNNIISCNGNIIVGNGENRSEVNTVPTASTAYFGIVSTNNITQSLFQFCVNGPCTTPANKFGPCAIVTVQKSNSTVQTGTVITTIESRGYNTCNIDSAQRFERALYVTY